MSDIRAAAERLIGHAETLGGVGSPYRPGTPFRLQYDEILVGDHIRTMYDDQPVDEDWLRSVGKHIAQSIVVGPLVYYTVGRRWEYRGVRLADELLATRGRVRRLCAALGVPLREGGES